MKAQELKAFMDAHKMTQKQVATLFDVSITTVSQYLNGKYPTDTKWLDEKVDELLARHKAKVVEAKYNKGILRITLPRAEADKPRKISVKTA